MEVAVDGQQGLAALQRRIYDLVVCDIDMPNMNGLECVRQLRAWEEEHRPEARQLVCCVTGEDATPEEEIKGAGFDELLRKPCTMTKLKNLITTVAAQREFSSAAVEAAPLPAHEATAGSAEGEPGRNESGVGVHVM